MRVLFMFLWCLVPAIVLGPGVYAQGPQDAGERAQQCAVCHGELGEELGRSVHAAVGIGCTDCHGGVSDTLDEAEAHGDDLASLTDARAAVEACGTCHSDPALMRSTGLRTDVRALWETSRHGAGLAEDEDADVATCISCHGAHEVLPALDPRAPIHRSRQAETCGECHADGARMEPYGLATNVVDEYRNSVHGRAVQGEGLLSSPACADCHGAHGAKPPTVAEIGQVCGHCHTLAQRSFERGPHMEAARAKKLDECISCHGYHAVEAPSTAMLVGDADGHCGSCHVDGDAGLAVAAEMHAGLSRLDARIVETERTLASAAAEGLFLEREQGYLDEAHSLRLRAGPLTHSVSPEVLADLMNRGDAMVEQTLEGLAVKNRALRDRRMFTAVYLAVILALVAVLWLYRREMYGGAWGARDRGEDALRGGAG
jgi:hypothetical protein